MKNIKLWTLITLMVCVSGAGLALYYLGGFDFRAGIRPYFLNVKEVIPPQINAQEPECLKYIGVTSPKFTYCKISLVNNKPPSFVVIGDSHANAAFYGISKYLESKGISSLLLADAGNPLMMQSEKYDSEQYSRKMATTQILQAIENSKEISTALIFVRGALYLTGTEPITNERVVFPSVISDMDFVDSLQVVASKLASMGVRVYFISENPELPFSPSACFTRPLAFSKNACELPKILVEKRQSNYSSLISRLNNVNQVSVLELFCQDQKCRILDESGRLLYSDDDHLSINGSAFQANYLFERYLKSRIPAQ